MTPSAQLYKRAQPALGTFVEITTEFQAPELCTQAFQLVRRLEKIFNCFDPDSEISKLNRTKLSTVSPELRHVLEFGSALESLFTETFRLMPSCTHSDCYKIQENVVTRNADCHFNLGGIAKGYIVDSVFDFLAAELTGALSVNAGGDLRVRGTQTAEIRIPGTLGERRFTLELKDQAVATSSVSYGSVGTPSAYFAKSTNYASAAVVASNCITADAFTKVALFSQASLKSVPGIFRFDASGARL